MAIKTRIFFRKQDGASEFEVRGNLEDWMKHSLLAWIILWLTMGLYVVYYMASNALAKEVMLFFGVYLVFWAWFLYKATFAFVFKVFGAEWISLTPRELIYGRRIFNVKTTKFKVPLEGVQVERLDEPTKSFGFVYSQSFWIVGNQKLQFVSNQQVKPFGMHLSPSEANDLLGKLNKRIKNLKKS